MAGTRTSVWAPPERIAVAMALMVSMPIGLCSASIIRQS